MTRPTIGVAATSIVLLMTAATALAAAGDPLPGTQPLTTQGDLASQMVDGIDKFLLRETAESVAHRPKRRKWEDWYYPLRNMLGVVEVGTTWQELSVIAPPGESVVVGRGAGFEAYAVRWPALKGVEGEGLLLVPTEGRIVAEIIAIPDADQTPEMIAGLTPGVPLESQFARRLAESGCRVLVPFLIDRSDRFSVSGAGQATNQPHREWVYRPAFELGRHVIGYELQKILAGAKWLQSKDLEREKAGEPTVGVGVIGYGEGGMLALYAASLNSAVDAVCVSGYFGPREGLWQEPIYRNVFGLLREFGDAELAALLGQRRNCPLIVEACAAPRVDGPPKPRPDRKGAAPGQLRTPTLDEVRAEIARAEAIAKESNASPHIQLIVSGGGNGPFASDNALSAFRRAMWKEAQLAPSGALPVHLRERFDPQPRLKRQIEQMADHTEAVFRESEFTRRKFWGRADAARAARSPEQWKEATDHYRKVFYDEVIGRFDRPLLPPNVRTRQVYDDPEFTGYEVVLDVFPDVFAYGILLVPKGIKDGERRPVVVCQHGLEGRPQDVADPKVDSPYYHRFACQLAERGFITYAPQNPYIFGDRFRTLQRKANPLGKTLFSIIVPQHQQTTDWLATLPFVDPGRIAFYGLSYGGKTAMRVPPLVDRYCLSICSADFNEWIWKNTSVRSPYSYVPNIEYEIFEWDLGNTFNYAEMAGLICPRPFMVERGHKDGVAPDEWVAYEYAKVRGLYTDLKIPERTTIEFFDGPHTINGKGTFDFLHEHLNWPKP
jgi:dienelactone hydrolase